MKLLLTSAGLTNDSLRKAFIDIVGNDIRCVFIPTAAGDLNQKWLKKDIAGFEKLGKVEIADIATMPKNVWFPMMKNATAIVVGGGNNYHLMHWMNTSGLAKELPELLKTRAYVGISAGSMNTSKKISYRQIAELYLEEGGKADIEGLGYIDFYILPHLNSPSFKLIRSDKIKETKNFVNGDIYALDDQSGILVDGKNIKVISEGTWEKY